MNLLLKIIRKLDRFVGNISKLLICVLQQLN